jgi:Anthrone oxygenase
MLEFLATLCSGLFAGAAIYVSLVQQPAALGAEGGVAGRLFAPMYARASRMQAPLAFVGSAAGLLAWITGSGWLWLLGALLLAGVIPLTLLRIQPITRELLAPDRDPEAPETIALLDQWGALHGGRSVLGALSFLCFLLA